MSDNGAEAIQVDEPQQDEQNEVEEVAATTGSPSDFLKTVVGEHVVVRLNSGVDYRGTLSPFPPLLSLPLTLLLFAGVLSCLDGYMNIAVRLPLARVW